MFKILTGPRANLLGRGAGYGASATGPESSAAADSAFPLVNTFDGRPANPFRLAAVTTGFYVRFPNNLIANGDLEQGAGSWTASNATLTSETGAGNYHKGAKSLKMVTTSANGYAYQDITVQAGEYIQLWAAAKSDGTNSARVILRCLETQQDLKSDGTWGAPTQYAMTKTGNTMTAFTPVAFQVPTFTTTGKRTMTLRMMLQGSANAMTLYWDEVLLVPGINFVGVFGHGLSGGDGLTLNVNGASYWHSASSSISFGTAANLALARQAASVVNSSLVYDPFPEVRFHVGGAYGTYTSPAIPWVGEIVVGQLADLVRNPNYPVSIEYVEPNVRLTSSGGTQWVMPRGTAPRRKVTLSFDYFSDAAYQDARDNLYAMSQAGAYPVVLVPTETDSGEAIYGRLQDATTFRRDNFTTRVAEFVVQEEAFPWL